MSASIRLCSNIDFDCYTTIENGTVLSTLQMPLSRSAFVWQLIRMTYSLRIALSIDGAMSQITARSQNFDTKVKANNKSDAMTHTTANVPDEKFRWQK